MARHGPVKQLIFLGVCAVVLVGVLLVISGGGFTEVSRAKHAYQLASEVGDKAEECKQARLVAEAYLHAGNREEYASWAAIARLSCLN